jgi:hypothetical protein
LNENNDSKTDVNEDNLRNQSIPQLSETIEQNSGNVQISDHCLKDCLNINDSQNENLDKTQTKPMPEVSTCSSIDVEMKNAESVENLAMSSSTQSDSEEIVNFKLIYNKTTYDIDIGLNKSVFQLKEHIQTLTSVAPSMQKLCFKGIKKKLLSIHYLIINAIIDLKLRYFE